MKHARMQESRRTMHTADGLSLICDAQSGLEKDQARGAGKGEADSSRLHRQDEDLDMCIVCERVEGSGPLRLAGPRADGGMYDTLTRETLHDERLSRCELDEDNGLWMVSWALPQHSHESIELGALQRVLFCSRLGRSRRCFRLSLLHVQFEVAEVALSDGRAADRALAHQLSVRSLAHGLEEAGQAEGVRQIARGECRSEHCGGHTRAKWVPTSSRG